MGTLFLAIAPLAAQTESVPDPSTPPDNNWLPAKPATPATPEPQTSAATVVSDSNSTPGNNGVLSAAAGPTPIGGPGAPPPSDLGSQINSAALSDKLPFRVTAALGEIYNSNIFNQPKEQSDFITRLSVRGEFQIGDLKAADGNYFHMVYQPSLHLYADHSNETGVDQYVDALFGHHWTKLTLTLEQLYTDTQETDATVGGLVTAEIFTTIAKAKYYYSHNLDFVLTGRQQFTSYDQSAYTNSKEWYGDLYALYHIDPKLSVGIGPRIGYLNLETSPNESYQQILAHVLYVPNDRMHGELVVGGEDRQYQTVGRSNTLAPIFEFAGTYQPNPSTTIALNSTRRFLPSYNLLGEDYISTNIYLTATQRFLQRYYVAVASGYENDEYQFVNSALTGTSREDNYFFVQPSLTWKANGWLKVAAFDRYEEDSSNFNVFTYDTNQVGVSVSATY